MGFPAQWLPTQPVRFFSFHSVQLLITQNTWGTSTISSQLLSTDMFLSAIWDLLVFCLDVSDVCYLNTHMFIVTTYSTHIFTWGLHPTKEQGFSVTKLVCVAASNGLCLLKLGHMCTIQTGLSMAMQCQRQLFFWLLFLNKLVSVSSHVTWIFCVSVFSVHLMLNRGVWCLSSRQIVRNIIQKVTYSFFFLFFQ